VLVSGKRRSLLRGLDGEIGEYEGGNQDSVRGTRESWEQKEVAGTTKEVPERVLVGPLKYTCGGPWFEAARR